MSATLVRAISGLIRIIIVSALFFGTLLITLAGFTAGMANGMPMVLAILIGIVSEGFCLWSIYKMRRRWKLYDEQHPWEGRDLRCNYFMNIGQRNCDLRSQALAALVLVLGATQSWSQPQKGLSYRQ